MNRPGSFRFLAATLMIVTAACVGLVWSSGCNKRAKPSQEDKLSEGSKVDPWEALVKRLRKSTDPVAVKTAFTQFAGDLVSRDDVLKPTELTPEAEKALAEVVPLLPTDLAALRPATYGGLDSLYLAECGYLRDAARSVDPVGLPPADLARAGFAWMCRQVYLQPWYLTSKSVPTVPPVEVLRRGHGSVLERAYVFLALLQQMSLDGCLIGSSDAKGKPAAFPNSRDRGPFWAVGVRVGGDVLLFDPWRGLPFPGPTPGSTGTLAQVKANPDQLKAWFDDKTWGITPDDVKTATVFLAVPITGLAPRMAQLEEKTRPELGLRLGINPTALRDRFVSPPPTGSGIPAAEVKFWNPPEGYAYGRVLATFTPVEDGGTDRESSEQRLAVLYHRALLPREAIFTIPSGLTEAPANRLRVAGALQYEAVFLAPPTPRELLQRGQFQEATRNLTDRQDGFVRGLERVRTAGAANETIANWCKAANEVYARLYQAYPDLGQSLQRPPDSDPAVVAARGMVEEFWKQSGPVAQLIIDQAWAQVGMAESTFLLALVKHEVAERQQMRADRSTGAEAARAKAAAAAAWGEAANAWAACLDQLGAVPEYPGRTAHAKTLAERARALAPAE